MYGMGNFRAVQFRRPIFDIAYIGDFRSPVAAVIAEEIAVHAQAGYRTLLISVPDPRLPRNSSVSPEIIACVEREECEPALSATTAVRCRSAFFMDPTIERLPEDFPFRFEHVLLPIRWTDLQDAAASELDLDGICAKARALHRCPVDWVPAETRIRDVISTLPGFPSIAAFDWTPVFSHHPSVQKQWPGARIPIAGRLAPATRDYWPKDVARLLKVYPICSDLDIHLLEVPGHLLEIFGGRLPGNWVVFKDGWISVDRFLQGIDFFLAPQDPERPHFTVDWRTLWAMRRGVIPVLHPELSDTFGDAAIYAESPEQIREVVGLHHRDSDQYLARTTRAQEHVLDYCSAQRHLDRLRAVIGKPWRRSGRGRSSRPSKPEPDESVRLLFVATNGIGLGHLSQLLAIARKLPSRVTPIFVTNSQAISAVKRFGYIAHYLPDDKYTRVNTSDWNDWLERELGLLISLYDAKGIVFDGVWCFDGLFRAAAHKFDFTMVWVRIPMWKRAVWDESTDRAKYFDLTIDVGELAQARNRGARIPYPERHCTVPPVVLYEEDEILSRSQARKELGLPYDEMAVMLQLGSGNNWSLNPVISRVCSVLRDHGISQIVNAEWLIADNPQRFSGVRRLCIFPISRYAAAFDFALSAAGYNAYHEQIAYGVPTVFFPNENLVTDDQLGRAVFAEDNGLGYCVRENELDKFEDVLHQLLDSGVRERIRGDCTASYLGNGADEAASLIAEQIFGRLTGAVTEQGALTIGGSITQPGCS